MPGSPRSRTALAVALLTFAGFAAAQNRGIDEDPFRQLEEILPTPNEQRNAAGAPGHAYWQQRADYEIEVGIDEETRRLSGREKVRYHNHSPDTLTYLWLQLDANIHDPRSDANLTRTAPDLDTLSFDGLRRLLAEEAFEGGVTVSDLVDGAGQPLAFTVVKTMMRIDLPRPLAPGADFDFALSWTYVMNRSDEVGGRSAAEWFERDGNWIFEAAQWFPRLCAYTDVTGWQHKQFLGAGEFTLELGDYRVRITMPADHVVAATGVLQNPEEVLDPVQRERLAAAQQAKSPVFIVTPEEARRSESGRSQATKTWIFHAENVRDFAFASSRKFAWDAMGVAQGDRRVMAMSYFPNEGEPLWHRYSTQAVAHTIEVYSAHTFDYPYPVAISVNGPVGGMEYPMICFNGPRPEADGTYSERSKYGLISVVIHEVGHNWFPMIINSDEREWTWMDEGLNTFLQYLAEKAWDPGYPSRRGEARDIVPYMAGGDQVPIMTSSDSLLQFGNNAYAKPATALNILRETVMGRELFDFAFREYARRWRFKRPMPADFFRSMEDASAIDLDWFWRGWFYGTQAVDVAIQGVSSRRIDRGDPDENAAIARARRDERPRSPSELLNAGTTGRLDRIPDLRDFYDDFDPLDVRPADRREREAELAALSDAERKLLDVDRWFTIVDFENLGGLPTPLPVRLRLEGGKEVEVRIPAEICRKSPGRVQKLFVTESEVVGVDFDPREETADVEDANDHWPRRSTPSRFRLFKDKNREKNPMQQARDEAGGSRPAR